MGRLMILFYGVASYLVFFLTFLYAIAFVGNLGVPRSVDVGPETPIGMALAINAALLTVFAAQHSVMARQGFKKWWTRIIPKQAERSTFVLASSLALILLYAEWRPIAGTLWRVEDPTGAKVLEGVFGLGWFLVLTGTFMINHFDLFGLRQVWENFRGQTPQPIGFQTPYLYKYARHPIYLGFLIGFWATPQMSYGHLMFAVGTTGYILLGIYFEERDLVHFHGNRYRRYQEQVPMLVPLPGRAAEEETASGAAAR
ncbi:MAG: isoprenylcysteine carboxylmethyltransferase family protein [Acidobacteriia bacterium]|nr:isoprenylcysteine carboxylmethyltransferase family protein [Terriglobia bacterium]